MTVEEVFFGYLFPKAAHVNFVMFLAISEKILFKAIALLKCVNYLALPNKNTNNKYFPETL